MPDVPFRKVTAIVRHTVAGEVEEALVAAGATGITVTSVKGFGEYRDFYARDSTTLTEHVRLEVFTTARRARDLIEAICEVASTGLAGDGIIAVLPVETVVHIRDGHTAGPDEI